MVSTTPDGTTTTTNSSIPLDDLIAKAMKDGQALGKKLSDADLAKALATIKDLEAYNSKLKLRIEELSVSHVDTHSDGGGPVVVVPPTTPDGGDQYYQFKDWRLTFVFDQKQAHYELNQQFEILHTTGRDKNGAAVSTVRLYEIDAEGKRVPVSGKMLTTAVVRDDRSPHFFISPTIQAGYGLTYNFGQFTQGALVNLQWLKYGLTKSAEDSSIGLFSPAVFLTRNDQIVGIVPVNYNLGRLPHQPFKDLWVSPFIGVDTRLQKRYGISFGASF